MIANNGNPALSGGRPLRRWPTRALIATVAVLVVALAVVLAIATRSGGPSAPTPPQQLAGLPAPGVMAGASHALAPGALHAARTFLDGYLAYVYGQGAAQDIKGASASVIAALSANQPQVSSAARALHPRVVRIGAREARGSVLHVKALIQDGVARYPIGLVVSRGAGGWKVSKLSNSE